MRNQSHSMQALQARPAHAFAMPGRATTTDRGGDVARPPHFGSESSFFLSVPSATGDAAGWA